MHSFREIYQRGKVCWPGMDSWCIFFLLGEHILPCCHGLWVDCVIFSCTTHHVKVALETGSIYKELSDEMIKLLAALFSKVGHVLCFSDALFNFFFSRKRRKLTFSWLTLYCRAAGIISLYLWQCLNRDKTEKLKAALNFIYIYDSFSSLFSFSSALFIMLNITLMQIIHNFISPIWSRGTH